MILFTWKWAKNKFQSNAKVKFQLIWLSYPQSRDIWPRSQRPMSSCRITESGERRYFGHGSRKCSFPATCMGIFCFKTFPAVQWWWKFATGWKNLWFDGFPGHKPPSSRQGPDRQLLSCAAITSYYEESDRGQTVTAKEKRLNWRIHTKKHRNTSKVSLPYLFYRKISKNDNICRLLTSDLSIFFLIQSLNGCL